MNDITQFEIDELVNEYTTLQNAQEAIDESMASLKERILNFSKKNHLHDIKSKNVILRIYKKVKTILPKKDEPGRKQIEDIMRNSKGEWKHAINFDITKLGKAYDKKILSEDLRKQIEPYTKQEEVSRIIMQKLDKK